MSFEEGQKLLYLTIKDERPHAEVVTFNGGTQFDQCDVISSNVYTKEQILEMFDGKSCICPSSPPGVLLDDGTCGNCGGVVKPASDFFYEASMERRYGLRVCPGCGHANRHPNNHCDKCTKYLKPIFKMMNCPRCGGITRKGNRCDSCDSGIPLCYGVVAPRTQDCANCIYTVECIEEQKRPVPLEEPPEEYLEYDPTGKDLSIPEPPIIHAEPERIPPFKGKVMQDPTILCPNCKQPVSHKHEHSEGDYDGDSVSSWWECPDVETKEEVP